jgi:hypothetical protein
MVFGDRELDLNDISKIQIKDVNKIFNPLFYRNIYNFGYIEKIESIDVSDEMNKPDIKKKEK